MGRWAWLSGLRGREVVVLDIAAVAGAGLAGSRATVVGLGELSGEWEAVGAGWAGRVGWIGHIVGRWA